MSKEPFMRAMEFVSKWEGGYSDHPSDPGGATNFGVTQKTYDVYRRRLSLPIRPVKDIVKEEVNTIYYNSYWKSGKCDLIADICGTLAVIHFDSCVNLGVKRANTILQKTLSVTEDGIIGPNTLLAIDPDKPIGKRYIKEREGYYRRLADRRKSLGVFLKGWLNRLNDLSLLCNEDTPEYHIKKFQEYLKNYIDPGPIDGLWGNRTQRATEVFFRNKMNVEILFK